MEKLSVLREKAQPSLKEFDLFFAKGDQIVRYTSRFTVQYFTAEKYYVTGLVFNLKKEIVTATEQSVIIGRLRIAFIGQGVYASNNAFAGRFLPRVHRVNFARICQCGLRR